MLAIYWIRDVYFYIVPLICFCQTLVKWNSGVKVKLGIQLNPTYSNPELFELLSYSNFPLGPLNLGFLGLAKPHLFESPAYSNFFPRSLESSNSGVQLYIFVSLFTIW